MESVCAQGSPFTQDGHTRCSDSKTARVPGAGFGRCRRKPRTRCDLEAGRSVAVIPQEDVMVNPVGGRRVTCTLPRPHWNLWVRKCQRSQPALTPRGLFGTRWASHPLDFAGIARSLPTKLSLIPSQRCPSWRSSCILKDRNESPSDCESHRTTTFRRVPTSRYNMRYEFTARAKSEVEHA